MAEVKLPLYHMLSHHDWWAIEENCRKAEEAARERARHPAVPIVDPDRSPRDSTLFDFGPQPIPTVPVLTRHDQEIQKQAA